MEDNLFILNVGDSRALLSKFGGDEIGSFTKDHKPYFLNEFCRIIQKSGELYKMSKDRKTMDVKFYTASSYDKLK